MVIIDRNHWISCSNVINNQFIQVISDYTVKLVNSLYFIFYTHQSLYTFIMFFDNFLVWIIYDWLILIPWQSIMNDIEWMIHE